MKLGGSEPLENACFIIFYDKKYWIWGISHFRYGRRRPYWILEISNILSVVFLSNPNIYI